MFSLKIFVTAAGEFSHAKLIRLAKMVILIPISFVDKLVRHAVGNGLSHIERSGMSPGSNN